jgi:conjugal transfer pilus assembly protein TraB
MKNRLKQLKDLGKFREFDFSKYNVTDRLKARSKLIAILGALFVGVIILSTFFFSGKKQQSISGGMPEKKTQIKIQSPGVDAENLWRNQVEENIEIQGDKLLKNLESVKSEITKSTTAQEAKYQQELNELKNEVRTLASKLDDKQNAEKAPDASLLVEEEQLTPRIAKFTLSLNNPMNSEDYESLKTPDNYIAAGSFARAILLSGMDVSTSLKAAENPEPVIMRITDNGTLPRRFVSDLMDCHVIGSAFGDLSSERAKLRLEKLSCVEIKTGEIIETEIGGFVTGEDGRQGIRGTVVSVDSKFLQNSLIGGVLSGLANSVTESPDVVNPFTIGMGRVSPPNATKRLSNNLLAGAGNSLDRLSEYYIDRAESVQPVIQIAAGRVIDIVFNQGVFFGTSTIKKEVAKKRDSAIRERVEEEANQFVQPIN